MSNVIQFPAVELMEKVSGGRPRLIVESLVPLFGCSAFQFTRQVLTEMQYPGGGSELRSSLNPDARAELIKLGEMLTAKVAIRKARQVPEAD